MVIYEVRSTSPDTSDETSVGNGIGLSDSDTLPSYSRIDALWSVFASQLVVLLSLGYRSDRDSISIRC